MSENQIQVAPQGNLPVGVKRVGKTGSDLGTRFNFKSDEQGNPVASPANLRKFYKEQKGLTGNALTAKVNEVWKDNEQMDRAMYQIFGNHCFDLGMRPSVADISATEKGAVIRLKAATEVRGKSTKVDQALVRAALAMQKMFTTKGITLSLDECLKVVKG